MPSSTLCCLLTRSNHSPRVVFFESQAGSESFQGGEESPWVLFFGSMGGGENTRGLKKSPRVVFFESQAGSESFQGRKEGPWVVRFWSFAGGIVCESRGSARVPNRPSIGHSLRYPCPQTPQTRSCFLRGARPDCHSTFSRLARVQGIHPALPAEPLPFPS